MRGYSAFCLPVFLLKAAFRIRIGFIASPDQAFYPRSVSGSRSGSSELNQCGSIWVQIAGIKVYFLICLISLLLDRIRVLIPYTDTDPDFCEQNQCVSESETLFVSIPEIMKFLVLLGVYSGICKNKFFLSNIRNFVAFFA